MPSELHPCPTCGNASVVLPEDAAKMITTLQGQVQQWMKHGTVMQQAGHEMMVERDELRGLLRGLSTGGHLVCVFRRPETCLDIEKPSVVCAPCRAREVLARYDAKESSDAE